ncbi:SPOR domain-containing protein [Aurantimonas sp. C2-6-R+9]|uniref:SPOR domain-containing protein n=1 Tax=unclassified Aurantimonas TaxID=2638230 RepID=UPI002E1854EC|nr:MULTISPECIES: SPOR domain-containing protein [unclassified Aurantimonas]MEC5289847.1 SPOR domain-containing protein [Aurantimonas sp. C2-3-R2]MEC5380012.1 SPOR domain-containing protein [Aurantimonas sp. C2-6-R+9]MEC5410929.1 SPOR domain-containing protein [Aurantimonas sp. C2-4-R8]
MADTTSSNHWSDQQVDNIEDDPFAELSRLIDEPWGTEPVSDRPDLSASALQGGENSMSVGGESGFSAPEALSRPADDAADSLDLDVDDMVGALDAELNASFLEEDARESMQHSVRSAAAISNPQVIAPQVANRRVEASAGGFSMQPIEARPASDLEVALRGLSAPVNPRGIALQHSEAFAPARHDTSPSSDVADKPFDDFDELIASELAAMNPAPRPVPATPAPVDGADADAGAPQGHATAPVRHSKAGEDAPVAKVPAAKMRGGSAAADTISAAFAPAAASRTRFSPRMPGLAASVVAIAVVGAAAAYWVSGDVVVGSGDLLIVRADTDPVKVAPKDPGGRAIPNQNKAVYERVQSADADIVPAQQTLVTAAEEPVDLPGVDLNPISSARAAEPERIADAANDGSPIAVLTPRRVRTMTVRPDGTLVMANTVPETSMDDMRGNGAALIEASSRSVVPAEANASVLVQPSSGVPVPAIRPGSDNAAPVRVAAVTTPEPMSYAGGSTAVAAVETSALETVGSIAAAPATTPAPAAQTPGADGYFVQISSQPSESAAKQTSQTLGQRYAEVIGQRDLVIQSADIPGKGTYYRVRIATGSKSEASTLCTELKSAGGSCFVAR